MAVTTTALGFKKPDGLELVRGGDNAIADNAQTAQDAIAADRGRLAALETEVSAGGWSTLTPDPTNAGLYFVP